jgi:hypothetical protein
VEAASADHCPTCGARLAKDARFCPKDGTTIKRDPPARAASKASGIAKGDRVSRVTVPAVKSIDRSGDRSGAPTSDTAPATLGDPLVGCVLDGRYRVEDALGQGGLGAVYRAIHIEMKRPVAIKVMHRTLSTTEEFRRRFEREARAASRLSDPSCVAVLDFGRVQTVEPPRADLTSMPYLVMEYVRGQTLIDRLDDPISPTEAVAIARGVARALAHAHSLGILHRDVKPGNIMVPKAGDSTSSEGGRVKLLDFGLAKDLSDVEPGEPLTQAGTVFGTPSYLSPEQAAGRKLDGRTDVYSLGVVLFEMVCGRRPFVRDDPLDIVRDHLKTPPPLPREINGMISAELDAVIAKALAKDPNERYQTAEAFEAALAACPETGASPRRRRRRARAIGAGVVAGAVALALLLGIVIARRRTTAPVELPPDVVTHTPAPELSSGARRAFASVYRGRPDEAIAVARATLAKSPRDAWTRVALGSAYQQKLWCSDALEELDRALREAPPLRAAPEVTRPAIACLTAKTQAKAIKFLVDRVGIDAAPLLSDAAHGDPDPEVRRGAQRALDRLADSAPANPSLH